MGAMKRNLDFHQTFKPERSCLASLLTELSECNQKDIHEISSITGIPTGSSSGKVSPTIYYLEYMGLITSNILNKKYTLEYTSLGLHISTEDPGLMEELTLLLLHCMIARPTKGAELWSYIICNLLPKYHGTISKSNFDIEIQKHFDKNINISPFNGSYTGLFDPLKIIEISQECYSAHMHTFNPEFVFLYALILYEYWDEWFEQNNNTEDGELKISTSEITSLQLSETHFKHPFLWTDQEEYLALEAMHDKGIISLNRQMVPFSIRRVMSREEIEELLFSELC